jgi:hypothetical protein
LERIPPYLSAIACCVLLIIAAGPSVAQTIPPDPDTFLTFLEQAQEQDAVSARAYYDVIDPQDKKTTYAEWLVETGFIKDIAQYQFSGNFPVNDYATVVHKNVADLGFIRLVRVRCEPNCDDPNPDIYSVIENYPTFDDAADRTNRLASVTMEWAAAANGNSPADKFVTFYAFTGGDQRDVGNDPFAPDLDGRGNKQLPGLCNSCHGGAPRKLKANGKYRRQGDTKGLYIPVDLDNFEFDPDRPELSQAAQEAAYKKINQVALITHRSTPKFDEEAGITRVPGGHELIEGWYGGPGMPNATFDGEFVPAGWLPPAAPEDAAELYLEAVAPSCRSCHVQQKRELDFATFEGFMVFEDAHRDLVLRHECGIDDDKLVREARRDDQAVMPLALETYKQFWGENQDEIFKHFVGEVDCEDL